jgi:hypothetical protein
MRVLSLLVALTIATAAHGQWQMQDSRTTADLRGIDNVGGGVAWASGTNGTVLRSEDAGYLWQRCTIPPGAEHLDFRGIQAFDANTAIVMSSGPGDQSRLYKTTDGCQTWTLVFTNPDKTGFWDAVKFIDRNNGLLLGDPVNGSFILMSTRDGGNHWLQQTDPGLKADPSVQGAFAASNGSLDNNDFPGFGSGGLSGAFFFHVTSICVNFSNRFEYWDWSKEPAPVPIGNKSASSGIFAVAFLPAGSMTWGQCSTSPDGKGQLDGAFAAQNRSNWPTVAVGGDYLKPKERAGTAAFSLDGGNDWQAATTPPHGYRSAVAYDPATKTWITVGPNGTDISTDDGRNWRPLHPSPNDAPDADQHWNALSLPYAVGPHGRIGILNPAALKPTPTKP